MKKESTIYPEKINKNSSFESIKSFIHNTIPKLNKVLFNNDIKEIYNLKHLQIIVSEKSYRSYATDEKIVLYYGGYADCIAFPEYKRFQKDSIIGGIAFIHFQDFLMALIAHEYAHFVNANLNTTPKPHGKEFQNIYKILREYTNTFLPNYAVIGYSNLVDILYNTPAEFKTHHKAFLNTLREKNIKSTKDITIYKDKNYK